MVYSLVEEVPAPEIYCDIRVKCGLSPRSLESATIGLKRSIYGVSVINSEDGSFVGMGRIIGDEGCFLTIVDICVLPQHQKKKLGYKVMEALMTFVETKGSPDADVILIAVGDAKYLYEKFGLYLTSKDNSNSMRFNRKFIRPALVAT